MPDDALFSNSTGHFDAIKDDTLTRGLMARMQVAQLHGARLAEEYREKTAAGLLSCGLSLIPSDHLKDHQFVVSRGVYEAAKKMCEGL